MEILSTTRFVILVWCVLNEVMSYRVTSFSFLLKLAIVYSGYLFRAVVAKRYFNIDFSVPHKSSKGFHFLGRLKRFTSVN